MVSKGVVLVDIKVLYRTLCDKHQHNALHTQQRWNIEILYRNLWGCFEDNFEAPLSLLFSWPRLENSVSLLQVTAFAACLYLLGIHNVYVSWSVIGYANRRM